MDVWISAYRDQKEVHMKNRSRKRGRLPLTQWAGKRLKKFTKTWRACVSDELLMSIQAHIYRDILVYRYIDRNTHTDVHVFLPYRLKRRERDTSDSSLHLQLDGASGWQDPSLCRHLHRHLRLCLDTYSTPIQMHRDLPCMHGVEDLWCTASLYQISDYRASWGE